MFVLVTALAATLSAPEDVCAVGRLALQELPAATSAGPAGHPTREYVDTDPSHTRLMQVCPALRDSLPAGYRAADAAAWARAQVHAPNKAAPYWPEPATVYRVEVKFDADGRSATVEVERSCTGLCGGATESRYVRTAQGWHQEGEPRPLWVS